LGGLPRRLAREFRAAREDGLDGARGLLRPRGDGDPVAHRGEVGRRGGLVVEAAGDVTAQLALRGEDVVGAAVLDRDAAGDQAGAPVGLELLGEGVVPAESGEVVHGDGLLSGTTNRTRGGAPVARGPSAVLSPDGPRGARPGGSKLCHRVDLLRRGRVPVCPTAACRQTGRDASPYVRLRLQ